MFQTIGITEDERKLSEVRRATEYRIGAFEALKSAMIVAFKDVWYNQKLSPSEHFAILGLNAASLFIQSGALQQLIAQLDPSWQFLLPTYEYTIHHDGTVTVGTKLEPDPNESNPSLSNPLSALR